MTIKERKFKKKIVAHGLAIAFGLASISTMTTQLVYAQSNAKDKATSTCEAGTACALHGQLLNAIDDDDKTTAAARIVKILSTDMQKLMPPDKMAEMLTDLHKDIGKAHVAEATFSSDRQYSTLLDDGSHKTELMINTALENGRRVIAGWALRDVEAPKPSDAPDWGALAVALDRQAASASLSGNVLISRDGKTMLEKSYGMAERAFGVPNRADTRFQIASVSKLFTTTSIAQLKVKGKLSYADRVAVHLPRYAGTRLGEEVTLADLLAHRSGLGDVLFTSEAFTLPRHKRESFRSYIALIDPNKLDKPGEYQYSNAGYLLLGEIIEKLSGSSFEQYVTEHVLGPAGMKETEPYLATTVYPRLAVGYTHVRANYDTTTGAVEFDTFKDRDVHYMSSDTLGISTPAGGYVSSARDMTTFMDALASGKLVQRDELAAMHVAIQPVDYSFTLATFRGLGFRLHRAAKCSSYGHGGSIPGFQLEVHRLIEDGTTITVLSNSDGDAKKLFGIVIKKLCN